MSFNEIGVSGAILLVIISFVAFGFLKGALKLFYGFLCLCLTAIASWAGHQFLYPRLEQTWPNIPQYGQMATAIVCGIIVFLVLKGITDFFSDPFDEKEKKKSSVLGMLMGFTLGFAVCLFGMYRLLDKGSRAEMQYWLAQAEERATSELPRIARLKDKVLKTKVGQQIAEYFSIEDSTQQTLAKLAIMQVTTPKQFAALQDNPNYDTILQDPRVQHLILDPEVQRTITSGDLNALYTNPDFIAILADPEMNRAITEIDIEQDLKLR